MSSDFNYDDQPFYYESTDPDYEQQYLEQPDEDADQDILDGAIEGTRADDLDHKTVIQSKSVDRTIKLLLNLEEEIKKRNLPVNHQRMITSVTEEQKALSEVSRNEQGRIMDRNHLSVPVLTKYERSAILSERAYLIDLTGETYLENATPGRTAIELAEEELYSGALNDVLIIVRKLPNRKIEYWKLGDLSKARY
jgi:hypothetical protein